MERTQCVDMATVWGVRHLLSGALQVCNIMVAASTTGMYCTAQLHLNVTPH